jgi:hypothetical protein
MHSDLTDAASAPTILERSSTFPYLETFLNADNSLQEATALRIRLNREALQDELSKNADS